MPTTREGGQPSESPALAHRSGTLPKLHRQLSLVLNRTAGHDSASAALPPAVSPEEQIKVHRYERMMDRFQLRRVPTARTGPSSNIPVGTSHTHRDLAHGDAPDSRPASRRNSMEGAPTARRGSGSHSVYPTAPVSATAEDVARRSSVQHSSFQGSVVSGTEPVSATGLLEVTTFSPTGVWSRARLVVLTVVLTIQLVYMPFGVVYYPTNHPTAIVLDSIVDGVFLLNVVMTCNTATQTSRGQPVRSRRAIWRHYQQSGLAWDILAAVPFELMLQLAPTKSWLRWLLRVAQIMLQTMCLRRHLCAAKVAYTKEVIRADKSIVAAILYSRFSYLVRIGGTILMITLMAHYFACVWSALLADVDPNLLLANDSLELHVVSLYDTLQLLQGQGVRTTTPGQAVFCSVAVLLGSIILAVIFGHVAILVSNFSANQTSYQRKMERVFAIMGKLQLPHPIRERVHQYYEYLHAEYESLDGEIVKFAKELSHTLELEIVLFNYMDVVMHVPHWCECSPDFQKQLVLNLSVRVYLLDDFIMRRGEVGTECYIINRGTCKQHEYATGNYEPATLAMISEEDEDVSGGGYANQSAANPRMTARRSVSGPSNRATMLKRGQSIGAMSLLANYERSSDLRAVVVINSIVRQMMLHLADEHVPCMLMGMVRNVLPHATVSTGIQIVSSAMDPRENDPSIVFGVTDQLTGHLEAMISGPDGDTELAHSPLSSQCAQFIVPQDDRRPSSRRQPLSTPTPENGSELVRMVRDLQETVARMEERQDSFQQGALHEAELLRRRLRASVVVAVQRSAPLPA